MCFSGVFVPGKNLILKNGQILFAKGDQSDGMYLVRKGELQVYLEQQGREVPLANVSGGGMIGEMALFDQKPRSASVKAVSDVEITLITNEEFKKLLKQIPKWFTALMGTLSGRLRATNDRLQSVEAKSTTEMEQMQSILRIVHLIDLIWHRDGIKEGKLWLIEGQSLVQSISTIFSEDTKFINKILDILVEVDLLGTQRNQYHTVQYSLASRGTLRLFLEFFGNTLSKHGLASFPEPLLDLLKATDSFGKKSAYEKFTVSYTDLAAAARTLRLNSYKQWPQHLSVLKQANSNEFQVVNVSSGWGVKTSKKVIGRMILFHTIIRKLHLSTSGNH